MMRKLILAVMSAVKKGAEILAKAEVLPLMAEVK